MEHSPFPLSLLSPSRRYVDKLFFCLTWHRMHSISRKIGFILGIAFWPFILCVRSVFLTLKSGNIIRNYYDKSILKQFLEQITIGLIYGRPPHIYYMYGLFNEKEKSRSYNYITPQEFRSLVDYKNDVTTVANVNNKIAFESICRKYDLPCLQTLLILQHGDSVAASEEKLCTIPTQDLFIKPISGHGGNGCLSYTWDGNVFLGSDNYSLTQEALFRKLYDISFKTILLIQPKLHNHHYLESIGLSTLSTVRLLSALNKHGDVIVLRALFKIPMTGMIIDNLGAGGIACPVDLNTGQLGAGFKKVSSFPIEFHPETKILFQDIYLPLWSDVLELTRKAHKAFSGLSFAGWDIAITSDGCVLVEGNSFPAVESMQQAHGPLLEDKHFIQLYIEISEYLHIQ